ncbi:Uncharacterized protein dnl_55560 [Desulfonema limicola]|uniref:Uncharacterized protein n=1 Tax=Desulfonema limicola TaxID=45656 RepID=A0A975BD49_9BACT|nr:hypothetical protein [Desulfonema limicola]QTA83162.1 Uncharacterized protein dnl_55560 [Desulfonema limicola]
MKHTLKLELSDDIYILLLKLSEKAGQLPEIIATQWVISETRKQADDPLEKFIGKLKSNKSDWADNHDNYIGEKLSKEMKA